MSDTGNGIVKFVHRTTRVLFKIENLGSSFTYLYDISAFMYILSYFLLISICPFKILCHIIRCWKWWMKKIFYARSFAKCVESILNWSTNTLNETSAGLKIMPQGFRIFFSKFYSWEFGIHQLGSIVYSTQFWFNWLYYLAGRFNNLKDKILKKTFWIPKANLTIMYSYWWKFSKLCS